MPFQSSTRLSYRAVTPSNAFMWVHWSEDEGQDYVRQADQPVDWNEYDYNCWYRSAFDVDVDEPEEVDRNRSESDNYYLAVDLLEAWLFCYRVASQDEGYPAQTNIEFLQESPNVALSFGKRVDAEGLFTKFASLNPSPETLIALVRDYGFLTLQKANLLKVDTEFWPGWCAASEFSFEDPRKSFEKTDAVIRRNLLTANRQVSAVKLLAIEAPEYWMRTLGGLRAGLNISSELDKDRESAGGWVKYTLNPFMRDTLGLHLEQDFDGKFHSEVVAKDLYSFLHAQYALSISAGAHFRTCDECAGFFSVVAGNGRPDKKFCSDACRTRAYRKRKADRERVGQ